MNSNWLKHTTSFAKNSAWESAYSSSGVYCVQLKFLRPFVGWIAWLIHSKHGKPGRDEHESAIVSLSPSLLPTSNQYLINVPEPYTPVLSRSDPGTEESWWYQHVWCYIVSELQEMKDVDDHQLWRWVCCSDREWSANAQRVLWSKQSFKVVQKPHRDCKQVKKMNCLKSKRSCDTRSSRCAWICVFVFPAWSALPDSGYVQ